MSVILPLINNYLLKTNLVGLYDSSWKDENKFHFLPGIQTWYIVIRRVYARREVGVFRDGVCKVV